MIRTGTCLCGKTFQYEVGTGRDRIYCSKDCADSFSRARLKEQCLIECSTPGCNKLANRKGAGLCEACYMRLRRKGTVRYEDIARKYRVKHSQGYYLITEPSHRLADKTGYVYEHRFVFHNRYGEGPFKCHHCGKQISWGSMHIDHLDDDKTNNKIKNLVPSCPRCNQARGAPKMIRKQRENGIQIEYNGVSKTAGEWAKEIGISRPAFCTRVRKWGINRAVETPKGKTGPKTAGESSERRNDGC